MQSKGAQEMHSASGGRDGRGGEGKATRAGGSQVFRRTICGHGWGCADPVGVGRITCLAGQNRLGLSESLKSSPEGPSSITPASMDSRPFLIFVVKEGLTVLTSLSWTI